MPYYLLQELQKVTNVRDGSSKEGPLTCEAMREGGIGGMQLADCDGRQLLHLSNPF